MKRHVFVIAALVAALALTGMTGCKKAASVARPSSETKPVKVVIVVQQIPNELLRGYRNGDKVRVAESGAVIGTIESMEPTGSLIQFGTSEGKLVLQPSPLYKDLKLTVRGTVQELEDGYSFAGNRLWIGTTTSFTTHLSAFKGLVIEIETKDR